MSLDRIFNAIESNKCLAFLGAGASMDYAHGQNNVQGLPSGAVLAEALAQKCGYVNGKAPGLAEVAEYFIFKENGHRDLLEQFLQKEFSGVTQPRPIHTAIAQLRQIKIILTSNYDLLLEKELFERQRRIIKHVYNRIDTRNAHFMGPVDFDASDVVLHKMHGSIDQPNSMVITRSDYVRYLATLIHPDVGMPEYFWKMMIPQRTLLFLGYSLTDWNFQVIWEGVLAALKTAGRAPTSYAIVKEADDFQKAYWMARNIQLLECDLTEFAVALASRFNLEIPQLGIARQNAAKQNAGGQP